MKDSIKREIENIIQSEGLDYSVEEFQDKVPWSWTSVNQTLSEAFIREFRDRVNWNFISANQTLSEDLIREFRNEVDWNFIFACQIHLSKEALERAKNGIRKIKRRIPKTFKEKYGII